MGISWFHAMKMFYEVYSNCRIALKVGGGDTAHGQLPGLVSPSNGDILKGTCFICFLKNQSVILYPNKFEC